VSLCVPCREEGRDQEHHHFLDREDGRGLQPVCRWHFKGLPYPASKIAASLSAAAPKEERMGRKGGIDEDEFRKLYAEGLTDRQIGEKVGMTPAAVAYHRRRLGLKAIHRWDPKDKASEPIKAKAGKPIKPGVTLEESKQNGNGALVSVRVEALDAIWAGLEPEDKACLVNHLIEARGR
jgi:hypothetical protein